MKSAENAPPGGFSSPAVFCDMAAGVRNDAPVGRGRLKAQSLCKHLPCSPVTEFSE